MINSFLISDSSNDEGKSILETDFSFLNHSYEILFDINKEKRNIKIEYNLKISYEKLSFSGNPVLKVDKLTKIFIKKDI